MDALGVPILDQPEAKSLYRSAQARSIVRHRGVLTARILGIKAGDDLEEQRDILGTAGQWAAMIHRERIREDTAPADPAVGRL